MSYERWERPWSEREDQPPRRTRVLREVRPSDFFCAFIVFFVLALVAGLFVVSGIGVWIDVLRLSQKSKFTIHDVNVATVKIVLGAVGALFFLWLSKRMAREWWWALTTPADTIYIKRRY